MIKFINIILWSKDYSERKKKYMNETTGGRHSSNIAQKESTNNIISLHKVDRPMKKTKSKSYKNKPKAIIKRVGLRKKKLTKKSLVDYKNVRVMNIFFIYPNYINFVHFIVIKKRIQFSVKIRFWNILWE